MNFANFLRIVISTMAICVEFRKFILVRIFAGFPQNWQFRLQNDNLEIARNLVKVKPKPYRTNSHVFVSLINEILIESKMKKHLYSVIKIKFWTWSYVQTYFWELAFRLGWFTAYLANVFLTKLQGRILPRKSRDRIKPNGAFWS